MSPSNRPPGRPGADEFGPHAGPDIDRVEGDDPISALAAQRPRARELFERFGEAGGDATYAAGKWTVRQILGHLADDERIFAYRALRIARGDTGPLAGFDENRFAAMAGSERRSLGGLLAEYDSVREASLTLFGGFDDEAWLRRGIVDGYSASPRGLAFHIAGHELHHLRFLEERYLPLLERPG